MKREITSIDFGEWLREKRKEANLSQERFGEKVRFHNTSISRWERGDQFPPLDVAEYLVKFFGAELVIREKGNVRESDE